MFRRLFISPLCSSLLKKHSVVNGLIRPSINNEIYTLGKSIVKNSNNLNFYPISGIDVRKILRCHFHVLNESFIKENTFSKAIITNNLKIETVRYKSYKKKKPTQVRNVIILY